eukprot:TRINITY_DN21428_c0_g1_i1.p1 TRINITY_DN21428_c0_g1~~TRINITY_DN21428_c0_g1_i1.p1  ORF type:complete len:558 (-),score=157.18 TRINITY_DN21428_c0_g1_i1:46-1719(-)
MDPLEAISLRPGGGWGFGRPQTNSMPSSKPASSVSTPIPVVQTQSPTHNEAHSPTALTAIDEVDVNKSDGVTNDEAHQILNRSFLFGFQSCNDLPDRLNTAFMDLPDIQKSGTERRRSQSKGSGNRSRSSSKQEADLPRRAENRWEPRPDFLKDEKGESLRTITGILNMLSPEKFEPLTEKLCEVFETITESAIYGEAVAIVFNKAASEPNFSQMYATLCNRLNEVNIPLPLQEEKVTFKKVLLNLCQEEFEKTYQDCDPQQLPLEPEERLIAKEKLKKRKLGTVRFIGELFKSKLLSERIVHECIKILLNNISQQLETNNAQDADTLETHIELLTKLMITIGKLVDVPKAKDTIESHFAHFNKWSTDGRLPLRVRFIIQDLLELRKNGWVPRREDGAVKTLSDTDSDSVARQSEEERPTDKKAPRKKKLTQEEVASKTAELLEEYLETSSWEDILSQVGTLGGLSTFVDRTLRLGLDKHDRERDNLSRLLKHMWQEKILSEDDFVAGLSALLQEISDMEIDYPNIRTVLTKYLTSAISDGYLSSARAQTIKGDLAL